MEIYLAGGFNGNMSPFWRKYIEVMDEGAPERERLCRASSAFISGKETPTWAVNELNILETFYYARKNERVQKLLQLPRNFLLDSGAFTFMANSKIRVDWDEYTEEYAEFINKFNIRYFFELDIDSVIGLDEVERLRSKLEKLTNKRSIPVFHLNRGKEYFLRMCDAYDYVAFGGILTDGMPTKVLERYFPWFISQAHSRGARIHGLGYTSIKNLPRYHFDSVDSTGWLYGNRCGSVYTFDPRCGLVTSDVPPGKRLKSRAVTLNNYSEWVKYLKWARVAL